MGVPGLEQWIRERCAHYDRRFLSSDARFNHAHITVLAPLQAWDATRLASLAAACAPFDFTLADLGVFPNGVVHLRPDPAAPFRRLTQLAWELHPDVVLFGAPDPTPHLTLDALGPDVTLAGTRARLGGLLPVRCRAEALELVWYEAGNCHHIDSWPLGGVRP